MKSFLMYKDQDFDLESPLPVNQDELIQDLGLSTLFETMAAGDSFLYKVASRAILCGTQNLSTIRYRQEILKDCLNWPDIIREMYQIPILSDETKKERWLGFFTRYPKNVLHSSIDLMEMFVGLLKRLRAIADEYLEKFESEGFKRFFRMIQKELDDAYFVTIENHLKELRFRDGILLSAELGKGNEGHNYVLRRQAKKKRNWLKEAITFSDLVYSFYISDHDDAGTRALAELENIGINFVANALAQSADHIDIFLEQLRVDLAFYVACINLYERLYKLGCPVSYPTAFPVFERRHSFRGLYDACLALTMETRPTGNDLSADGKDLLVITGANQGGKSTFLRSIGQAQLMMQCGMYVPAEEFEANLCKNLFTHFKREEDATMKSGKLDEELKRMSNIVDHISINGMILFNESFAATNEREGSEIARQITNALLERDIKIFFVTHLYEFAREYYERQLPEAMYLRAERQIGGKRTFKIIEGEPLQTSFGEDLYKSTFHVTASAENMG